MLVCIFHYEPPDALCQCLCLHITVGGLSYLYMSELPSGAFRPEEELVSIYFDGEHMPELPPRLSDSKPQTEQENWEVTENTQSF